MNQQKQVVTQTVSAAPTAVISELSFCKTTARDLARWLQSLPKANTGEYSRQLYQALNELSKLQAAPELRIQLLEQVRSEVIVLTKQLENTHLLSSVILNSRANKVASLCQTLQHLLNSGYKQIVADMQRKRSTLLVLAIQRTLHGLFATLAHAYLTYRNVPAGLWFEIHQMYRLATHHKLHRQRVKDPLLGSVQEQTLEQAYCCALLLGSSRANQMRQSDIKALVEVLPRWSPLVKLQAVGDEGSLFAAALTTDTPPRYKALLNLAGRKNILGLNTSQLAEAITEALELRASGEQHNTISEHIPTQLLQQLANAWANIAKRGFPRNNSSETLELCLGMSSVHYHLAERQCFEDTLQQPPEETGPELSMSMDEDPADIWSMAADVLQEGSGHGGAINYLLTEGTLSEETPVKDDLAAQYPLLNVNIIDQSPGGYCLEWATNAPANLQTGDILSVRRDSTRNWSIATIRWISQNNQTGARIGVELLAHRATPCGTRLLRSGKAASNYLRALCIPEISAISRPAQVITAKIPFREGCTVTLNIAGEESRIVLGRLVQQTASSNQFEYKMANPLAKKDNSPDAAASNQQPAAGDRAKVVDQDDFTSLWDLL